MSKDYVRLKDVTPEDWITDAGLFSALGSAFSSDIPIFASAAAALELDYMGRSMDKIISPILSFLLESYDVTEISSDIYAKIAAILKVRHGEQWKRLYAVLSAQYDPITNYSMTETMTDDITTIQHGKTTERTLGTTESRTGSDTTEGSVYAFDNNTETPTPSDKAVTTYGSSVGQTGTITDEDSGTDTNTRNYELSREGNIGVTTSQQMLTSEIELWQYDFLAIVYAGIDELLTIPIY